MGELDRLQRENDALRDRLTRLSEATLRINGDLDLESVLQGVLDSARDLTGASYGVIVLLNGSGDEEELLTSGMSPEEAREIAQQPDGQIFFEYFSLIQRPLRTPDLLGLLSERGLPEFHPPMPASSPLPFLATPISYQGERQAFMCMGDRESGGEFTPGDEEVVTMFAAQAALVIANARRYREERQARAGLEALIQTSPVGVVVLDARTGELVSANREVGRISDVLGQSSDSLQALRDAMQIVTVQRADGQEFPLQAFHLIPALGTGESIHAEEVFLRVPDGRFVNALVNVTPIHTDEESEARSVVVTIQDIAPLRDLERLRAEFLGMVGHELRTPLTSIKGSAANLIEMGPTLPPAEMLQFHRIISDQADYMRDLITDLIDVVQIETGTLSVLPAPAEVARLVDEARNTFVAGGGQNGVRVFVPPDLPPVRADGRRIVQVLNNLLSNAARTSHETSTIRVAAVREGAHVVISVADEGKGLPPEQLPLLFRKFSQPEGPGQGRSLGLGLAICKGIVEAHGGRIWAESDGVGLGSRFTFTVPVAEEETETASANGTARGGGANLPRVLVVDDDPWVLRSVRTMLSGAGYEPLVTGNPGEVASLMEENSPDLVLLDIMLPGTDGISLLRDVLADYNVPVIFISANGQDDVIASAFAAGAVDYVVKPFSNTELAARLKVALRREDRAASTFEMDDLFIDYGKRLATVAGVPVDLTAFEYGLLRELSLHQGVSRTHGQLLQQVWGGRAAGDARRMRTVVKNLRRKLGDDVRTTPATYSRSHGWGTGWGFLPRQKAVLRRSWFRP